MGAIGQAPYPSLKFLIKLFFVIYTQIDTNRNQTQSQWFIKASKMIKELRKELAIISATKIK